MIVATLEHYGGHRAKAAQALGIGVRTLSGKLRAYGFAPHTREFASSETGRQELPNASVETAEPAARKTA
jgi:hypothetical protein